MAAPRHTGMDCETGSGSPRLDLTRYFDGLFRTSIWHVTASELDLDFVEGESERVLSGVPGWLWDGVSLPVPVDQIVDTHFSLLVREVDDMGEAPGCPEDIDPNHLSGLLLAAMGEIWVNRAEAIQWPRRRRFTIGHELGHWVMHRSGQQSLFCRHQTVDDEVPGQMAIDFDRADATAADSRRAVLADHADRRARDQARPTIPLAEAEANAFSAALLMPHDLFRDEYRRCAGDIARLQDRFDCSEKATRRRIETVIGS